MNLKRRSRAAWEGSVGEGSGTISLGSGTFEGIYSANARIARETTTTNPEELVAAAHASCFTMSLANALTEAGHPPARLDTTAIVHLEKREEGYMIPRIELEAAGEVEGIDQARFEELALLAERNCTISRLLAAADISVRATLEERYAVGRTGAAAPSGTDFDVEAVRGRYSSLAGGFRFFDAPGGTQVPDEVGEAMARALREASANLGAPYETGRRVERILSDAKAAGARMLGCDPAEVVFGANMTTLNFAFARTLARDLRPGDEIVVTRLDHDAGVAPWVELAEDLELEVRHVDLRDDLTLDLDDLERKLSGRTRVVAFAWASNAVGAVADARRVCSLAHEAGALAWIDAVHYAAHDEIDVRAVGADLALCSAYKWCGPHLGLAYVRPEVVERWRPFKARPSPDTPIGRRFETGTPPFELLAGLTATMEYLDSIGGFEAISPFERALGERFLGGLPDTVEVYGPQTMDRRVPTFLLNVHGVPARDVARRLAERGYGVWHHDSWYSLGLRPRLPYEHEAVRIGLIHYNTADEVDGLLSELAALTP